VRVRTWVVAVAAAGVLGACQHTDRTASTATPTASPSGYSRDAFGTRWLPVSGACDTREVVLARDLTNETVNPTTCAVSGGILVEPYTSLTLNISDTSTLDVDHIVALKDAWVSGADHWTTAQRVAFANDQSELTTTTASLNRSKGDGGPDVWMPSSQPGRCFYVTRYQDVKVRYGLVVTPAQQAAIDRVKVTCG
jgi:hypothetical protein